MGGLFGVLVAAIVLSTILTLTSHTTLSAQAKAGATSVQIKNFAFDPNALPVHAGDTVRLVVRNDDSTLHTFHAARCQIDVSVPPGTEKVIEFTAPAGGVYQWYCIPHSDVNGGLRTGMVGTLTVH